jgi:outer membrane receptor protein involved in Fe transport
MRNTILVMAFLAIVQVTFGQKTPDLIKIKGTVVDSASGETIPYTTISVLSFPDKIVKKRFAASADGSFNFEVEPGEYYLAIAPMGYKSYEEKITVKDNEKKIDIGKIVLSESTTELGTVDVIVQKPLIEVEADKIIYNTEADPDTKTSTALDMMRRVPLITVDGDDNIQLKGSSNFKIYMNGKPSTLMSKDPKEVLRALPASSIKNIEVITSPGAKYDAEGTGGIINIVTTKQVISGYSGSASVGYSDLGRIYGYGQFSAAIGKFVFSVNGGTSYNQSLDFRNSSEQENYNSDELKYMKSGGTSTYEGMHHWGNIAFSYEMDTLNLISGSVNFWGGRGDNNGNTLTDFRDANNILSQSYNTINASNFLYGEVEGSLDYQKTFKRNKEQILTLSYKLSRNPDENTNNRRIDSILNFSDMDERIKQNEIGNEHTFQIDYVQPIAKIGKIEFGTKYILRLNNSETTGEIFDFDNNTYVDDVEQNIDFDYTQNIIAGYVSFNGKIKKFGYKAGFRIENSETEGVFKVGNSPGFNNSSLEYVPSCSFSYQLGKMNSLQFAYAKRIQRPSIWFLNPYVDDSDPKNVRFGNPELDPEHFHQFDLNYNIFLKIGNINLSSFYSFSDNGINRFTRIDEDEIVYTTYSNIAKQKNYGGSINMNLQFGKSVNISTNYSSSYIEVESNNEANLSNSGWKHGGYTRFQLNFAKTYKLSSYGGVWSSGVQLQSISSMYYYYGMSLTKEFLKKKLSISVSARDFFEKERVYTWELFDPSGFYQTSKYYRPGRSFSIGINFRFGEMKSGVKRARRTIQNTDLKEGGGNDGGGGQGE